MVSGAVEGEGWDVARAKEDEDGRSALLAARLSARTVSLVLTVSCDEDEGD